MPRLDAPAPRQPRTAAASGRRGAPAYIPSSSSSTRKKRQPPRSRVRRQPATNMAETMAAAVEGEAAGPGRGPWEPAPRSPSALPHDGTQVLPVPSIDDPGSSVSDKFAVRRRVGRAFAATGGRCNLAVELTFLYERDGEMVVKVFDDTACRRHTGESASDSDS
ncbi:hypothetical protein QYE76_055831 [Lolium multiflorum]|uniref:Uncharacterized protein n=1 Tax=Lolium multiflorum TaxID=4521 RepID=A0AAD8WM87_LOLMU|nr:hypothetical protein QYE76_055831 [Lolium multiflorum]